MAFENIAVSLSTNVGAFRSQMATAAQSVRTFASSAQQSSAQASRASSQAGASFDNLGRKTKDLTVRMSGLRAAVAGVSAVGAIGFGLKMAADLELTRVAFTGLLGSAGEAEDFIKDLQEFTTRTPFEFPGVANAAQAFLALGHSTEQINEELHLIANALSVAGNIGDESMSRVVRALTQIEGKGRLSAEEINQMAEVMPGAGRAAIFERIAEALDMTTQEAQALAEQGLIPAEIGLQAIYKAMAEIPGAAGAADRASRTLTGTITNMKDSVRFALGEALTPLAGTIRDTLIPMINQLGTLMGRLFAGVGPGLGDAFNGIADAFETLAPNLPGIADAFGSLLSAAAALLPPMAELLNAVLLPLIPAIQAIAGLLEGLLGIPGVVGALQALAVAFVAVKVAQFAGTLQMLGGVSALASASLAGVGTAASSAAYGMASLQAAAGPLAVVIGTVGAAFLAFKNAGGEAIQVTADFTEALKETGVAADQAINKVIAAALAEKGVVDDLAEIGVPLSEVAGIIRNFTSAEGPEFEAFIQRLIKATEGTNVNWLELGTIIGTVGEKFRDQKMVIDQTTTAERELAVAGWDAAASQEAIADAIQKAFSISGSFARYQAEMKAGEQRVTDTVMDGIRDRFDARRDALDEQERLERRAYDKQIEERRRVLDEMLEAEREAIDKEHELRMDAIEDRFDAERDALDAQKEAELSSLKDRHRAEKDALDERIRLLNQATDKRKRALERQHANERDEVQFMIDSTFGAEREMWKARLIELDEQHEDRLDEIDNEAEREKTSWENALDDQQEAEKDSLDARYDYLTDTLDKREEAEKTAEKTRYDNAKEAFEDRAEQQKIALDDEVADHKWHLDEKYRNLTKNLEDQEKAASAAEKTRNDNAKASQGVALDDFQKFLDDELKAAEEFNANLALIASRGGADVIAEVAKLPPEIVAQAAKAGPEALNKLLETIRATLAVGGDVAKALGVGGPGVGVGVGWGSRPTRAFAAGGIRHAAISSSPILWAEAGPEAYIPLSRSRSRTSVPILAQTAAALGYNITPMAAGGIVGWDGATYGRGDVNFNMPISIEARVAAGVDPDAVGQAIAVYARRAVDEALNTVGRQVIMKSYRTR